MEQAINAHNAAVPLPRLSTNTENSKPSKRIESTFPDAYVDPYKLSQLLNDLFGKEKYSLRWRHDSWIVRAKDELTQGQINSVKV
jgi:hypothetical protein